MGFSSDTLRDRAAVFLASEHAGFITGETLYVSGGPQTGGRED